MLAVFFVFLYNGSILYAGGAAVEHWEALKPGGYRFVYDDALFRPGTDSFLLSSLPKLRHGLRVCDLGCGTGLLGLLLLQRQPDLQVTGMDILPEAVRLAQLAAEENNLTDRLTFHTRDLRQCRDLFPTGSFDLVVCNPPYYAPSSGAMTEDSAIRTARSEVSCSLEELCASAAYLLRWGGSFCLVHKPERLTDVLCSLRSAAMEPKRLRFVCKTGSHAPSLILVEGRRGGKSGLTVEPPLILQNPDGTPTDEVNAIYFRQPAP